MPRHRHLFNHEEIQLVRYSYKHDGPGVQELARRLGVSVGHLRDSKARGDFGKDLPRKKGGGRGRHTFEADDTPNSIMGVSRAEIEARTDKIRRTWSDEERNFRILYNPGVKQNKRTKTRRKIRRPTMRDC